MDLELADDVVQGILDLAARFGSAGAGCRSKHEPLRILGDALTTRTRRADDLSFPERIRGRLATRPSTAAADAHRVFHHAERRPERVDHRELASRSAMPGTNRMLPGSVVTALASTATQSRARQNQRASSLQWQSPGAPHSEHAPQVSHTYSRQTLERLRGTRT